MRQEAPGLPALLCPWRGLVVGPEAAQGSISESAQGHSVLFPCPAVESPLRFSLSDRCFSHPLYILQVFALRNGCSTYWSLFSTVPPPSEVGRAVTFILMLERRNLAYNQIYFQPNYNMWGLEDGPAWLRNQLPSLALQVFHSTPGRDCHQRTREEREVGVIGPGGPAPCLPLLPPLKSH